MSALQYFFDAERRRRGWSMRHLAQLSKMSLSKAYAIANGDDNVEFETFENIATAYNMSPAELAVAIGKGSAADDPKRVSIHAALREVPDEQLATVDLMIRGLAVQLINKGLGNGHRDGASTSRPGGRRALDGRGRPLGDQGSEGSLPTVHAHRNAPLANVFAFIKRWLEPSTSWGRLETAQ